MGVPAHGMSGGPQNYGCPRVLESAFALCLTILLLLALLNIFLGKTLHFTALLVVFALLVSQVCQECRRVRRLLTEEVSVL